MENRMVRPGWRVAVTSLALVFMACGGGSKSTKGPGSKMGGSSPGHITVPKVDPSLCNTDGKKVTTYDLNSDDKPDVWKLYKTTEEGGTTLEILTCKQVDLDRDGRKDYVVTYTDTGEVIHEEYDFTFEGHIDSRRHYDKKTGNVYLVERDSDHDKKPDIWEKFDNEGVLESVRRDRNADGKPDLWEEYEQGKLVSILYDDDFDNRVDRREVHQVKKAPAPSTSETTPSDETKEEAAPEKDDG
jgi:hypothetical protein